jgi:hypothetical protein
MSMKKSNLLALLLVLASSASFADQYVSPHVRSDGTYVQGYTRSSPNSTATDNYSHQGNANPYTGERGYKQNENSYPSTYGNQYNNNGSYGYGNRGNNR